MRRIFSGISTNGNETNKEQYTDQNSAPQGNSTIVRPNMSLNTSAINAATNLSTLNMSNLSNMSTTFTNRNPNDTLAEFFKRKGDQPLTEIEVEGVMSLINKTQTGSQSMFPNRTTFIYPQSGKTSANNSTFLHGYNQTVIGAENGQKTILRPNNLKEPVRIETPSYKPKIKTIRRPHLQRIVRYGRPRQTGLSIKKNFRSPLEAYREQLKEKKEAERKIEEQRMAEKRKAEQKRLQQAHRKRQKTYSGGVIDLTHLGESDDEEKGNHTDLPHKAGPTLNQSKHAFDVEIENVDGNKSSHETKKPMSKTAAHLLSIIEGNSPAVKKVPNGDAKENGATKPKEASEKVVKKAHDIETVKDERLEKLEKKEEEQPTQDVLTDFNINKPMKLTPQTEKPKLSTSEFKKPKEDESHKDAQKFGGFHFDSSGSFSKKLINDLKHDLKEAKKSPNGSSEKKQSPVKVLSDAMENGKEPAVTFAQTQSSNLNFNPVKPMPITEKAPLQIDKFSFPDVSSSNNYLLHVLESHKPFTSSQVADTHFEFSKPDEEMPDFVSEDIPQKTVVENFVFPTVNEADPSLLSQIDDNTVHQYDCEFIF